eukprot:m.135582 g.135582  ORF g.135582 m.135582 type:complete len:568 (-) comp10085_c0_seq1:193-1896(-)
MMGVMKVVAAIVVMVVVNGGADVFGSSLVDLIIEKENEVNNLAIAAKAFYEASLCGTGSCGSDLAACTSRLPSSTCATTYGGCVDNSENRNLDFANSVIRSASSTFTDDFRAEACWSQGLTSTFITQNGGTTEAKSSTTKWRYFGAPSGFYRIYPGVPQQTCNSYDPRLRPWYVAATSGPKDIVIVLDRSGSMSTNNKWETATQAVTTIFTTLTFNDHVALVLFDSSAKQICGGTIPCNQLSQATEENIIALQHLLDMESPSGNTNFQAGLDIAFTIFGSTSESTSDCHKAILFLTDGHVNVGYAGNDLLTYVDGKQEALKNAKGRSAIIFTFSFSSGADKTLPKALACGNNGTWSHVEYNINLREQMGNYYNYFSSLRSTSNTNVVWVEPYEDASGSGILTTASKAIYDEHVSPPRLIGVVAVDILASDLQATATDYASLLSALVQRSANCPSLELNLCQLSAIRTTTYSSSALTPTVTEDELLCSSTDLDGCTTPAFLCQTDMNSYTQPPIPTTSESDISFFGPSRLTYESEACQDCTLSSANHTSASLLLSFIALILAFASVFL